MGRISKVTNVLHSGAVSPIRLRVCDANILVEVLSAVISFFVTQNMNHQMRLISKDLAKIVASKSNGWILSYDQNNNANLQKGVGPYMTHFPLSGVLLFEMRIWREILLCESLCKLCLGPPARGNLSICAQYSCNFEGFRAPWGKFQKSRMSRILAPWAPSGSDFAQKFWTRFFQQLYPFSWLETSTIRCV